MSLLTYDELIETIGTQWLARDDLDANIKEFIWLAECDCQRSMRLSTTDAIFTGTAIAGQAYIDLPDDYAEGVRLIWTGDSTLPTLELQTRDIVASQTPVINNSPQPSVGDVFGDRLYIGPAPAATGFDLFYKRGVVHMSQNVQTTRLLREYPDALLHGALVEAGLFLKDTQRVADHLPMYQQACTTARIAEDKHKWGPGVFRMQTSVKTF